ncbi:MAG: acyltransferase [bacterium]|nr:acyltransferase [bacterium]
MVKERFNNWKYPKIEEGKPTEYNWVVQNKKNLKLGYKTDIGAFVYLNACFGIVIEDYVQVGGGVKIYSLDTISDKKGKVILKENCKIGANSVILPNTIIGENSIIGACSVVRYGERIPSNEIWAGSPAKKIGKIKNNKRRYKK